MMHTTNRTFLLICTIILGAGVAFALYYNDRERNLTEISVVQTPKDEVGVCHSDGKVCPDGSVISRSGPTCEFAACPGNIPASDSNDNMAIVKGTVTLSPVCPVEQNPPKPECAPKPYATDVVAFDEVSFEVVASTRTTSSGGFVLDLPPGDYTLRAKSGAVYPRCEEKIIKVLANITMTVNISCDSGIR